MREHTEKLPQFDPDLSPQHPANKEAAVVRNLRYDENSRTYKDEDGAIVRDRFGQPL